MDLSTKHAVARAVACRIPALAASLALLAESTQRAAIAIYGTTRPSAGAAAGGEPLVTIQMTARAGVVDAGNYRVVLDTPIEAQVIGANASTGTDALWARITDGAGDWWGDASVSSESGSGDVKLLSVTLYNGAYCRVTSAIVGG